MNKNWQQQTAAQRTFSQYVKYITKILLEEYGPSYANPNEILNTWRNLFPYSKTVEDFLIFKTKIFIRTLDGRDSNSTNPQFLQALIKEIADYLSAYTMKNPNVHTRKKAKMLLFDALYNQSAYIQNLLTQQSIARRKREQRQKTYKRMSRNKQKNIDDAARKFTDNQRVQVHIIETVIIKRR